MNDQASWSQFDKRVFWPRAEAGIKLPGAWRERESTPPGFELFPDGIKNAKMRSC